MQRWPIYRLIRFLKYGSKIAVIVQFQFQTGNVSRKTILLCVNNIKLDPCLVDHLLHLHLST